MKNKNRTLQYIDAQISIFKMSPNDFFRDMVINCLPMLVRNEEFTDDELIDIVKACRDPHGSRKLRKIFIGFCNEIKNKIEKDLSNDCA